MAFWALLLVWAIGFAVSLYLVEKMALPGPAFTSQKAAGSADPLAAIDDGSPGACSDQPLGRPYLATDTQGDAPAGVMVHLPLYPEHAIDHMLAECGPGMTLLADWATVSLDTNDPSAATAPNPLVSALDERAGKSGKIKGVLAVAYLELDSTAARKLEDAETRHHFVERLAAGAAGYRGICLYPLGAAATDHEGLVQTFQDLRTRLAGTASEICLIASIDEDLWRDPAVTAAADRIVLLSFHEPGAGSLPGPLAPLSWFSAQMDEARETIGPARLVPALGNFAMHWVAGNHTPDKISYAEAMRRAGLADARAEFPEDSQNTRFRYVDAQGRRNEIWLLDAVSAHNQLVVLADTGLRGVALWSAGMEDPGVWQVLSPDPQLTPADLRVVELSDFVGYDGAGSFLRVTGQPQVGERLLVQDPDSGLILSQTYPKVPRPYSLTRFGSTDARKIAITFDDGPDAEYTDQMLDVLADRNAPAAFFLIGSNILKNPQVVRRMVAEGHEIGSHTFFHPETDAISETRLLFELNALQRLIASVTGHTTTLFRTPYGRGLGPLTGAEAAPMPTIEKAGHIVVGSEIVPPDWTGATAGDLVAATRAALSDEGGNVIVLHDGGGDRSATVAALPVIIDDLRAGGYEIVSLGTLLGAPRDDLMPPVTGLRVYFDRASFALLSAFGEVMREVFWIIVFLALCRSVAVWALALLRRPHPMRGATDYRPPVTVLIPAFNEEAGIIPSVRAALASDYPNLRVVVVDDGSSDRTPDLLNAAYGADPRVAILREENAGKWSALDMAYAHLQTDIVVAIDADTILEPEAIGRLVQPFRDPEIGAVAGNVKVGNRSNLLIGLQALEYITAQNIDRRAAELFHGILVVPGAIGAWRADAVRRAGLYSGETLTEDADLTVSIQRAGYRVAFVEDAFSVTEAPDNIPAFLRQRLRWTFGMMQTAWKHRRAMREGRAVGVISFPDLWIFGVLLGLLAPLADLIFVWAVVDTGVDFALDRPSAEVTNRTAMIVGYLALPAMDMLIILTAFIFERRENPALILLLPFQRLLYRPLLYITVYRAVLRALVGRIANWGRITRAREPMQLSHPLR